MEFYAEIKGKMGVLGEVGSLKAKIRSFGRKNYFNEHYRHWFWLHMMDRPLKITQTFHNSLLDKC